MTFTVTPLHDNEFLVTGTDSKGTDNTIVLESETWAAYLYIQKHELVTAEFNEVVKAHFADITDAADKAKAQLDDSHGFDTVTVTQGTEGVAEEQVHLDRNGTLLNMLAQGKEDLLLWVGDRLVAVQ